jgi:FHS family glucose/mannose:H+ symporter-like MFS transporter
VLQHPSTPRRALWGFLLSGLLMSLLGAILPVWNFHLRSDYAAIGDYFLALTIGMVASVRPARFIIDAKGIAASMRTGCVVAILACLALYLSAPPAADLWRYAGILLIGAAAGTLNTATFYAISPLFRQDPPATVNLSGTLFGAGCLITSLLAMFTEGQPSALLLGLLAAFPIAFVALLGRSRFDFDPELKRRLEKPSMKRDFRSPSAILLGLLLFFQFGNEWSIAGWLAVFLIHRLGLSPTKAIGMLCLYWLALLLGRVLAQWILGTVRHGKLLGASVVAAMFGCITLAFTNNLFGAGVGILLVGLGFAAVYPLLVERIGARFPYYHPGLFNGIFSFALTGGMLAPWVLGFFADAYGIQVIMALPMLGTCAVVVFLLLIWLEAKMSRGALSQS